MRSTLPPSFLRELTVLLALTLAVILPFANGALAGRPAEDASLDLRYVLVLSGAIFGLLSVSIFQPTHASRARMALVFVALAPIASALRAPRDAFWVSLLTIDFLVLGPSLVGASLGRLARERDVPRPIRIGTVLVLAVALAFPWATLSWGLLSVQLGVAPVRLAHQRPLLHEGEEEVEFSARDGTVIRGTYTKGRRNAGGVIVLHGVSDGRTRMAGWSSMLGERGYHALRMDWRAHGRSEGSVVTFADRERQDLEAAFEWLRSRPGVDGSEIAIVGTSMGAGVALSSTEALAPSGLVGIVAFAPPSDYSMIIERRISGLGQAAMLARFFVDFVSRGLGHESPLHLRPARALARGPNVPVLLFHGDDDHTIPLEQSRKLAALVPSVELHTLAGVGHDEIPAAVLHDDDARRRILRFLRNPE